MSLEASATSATHDDSIERWRRYRWQLIRPGPMRAALHMALDEVLLAEVSAGRRSPSLRI